MRTKCEPDKTVCCDVTNLTSSDLDTNNLSLSGCTHRKVTPLGGQREVIGLTLTPRERSGEHLTYDLCAENKTNFLYPDWLLSPELPFRNFEPGHWSKLRPGRTIRKTLYLNTMFYQW